MSSSGNNNNSGGGGGCCWYCCCAGAADAGVADACTADAGAADAEAEAADAGAEADELLTRRCCLSGRECASQSISVFTAVSKQFRHSPVQWQTYWRSRRASGRNCFGRAGRSGRLVGQVGLCTPLSLAAWNQLLPGQSTRGAVCGVCVSKRSRAITYCIRMPSI